MNRNFTLLDENTYCQAMEQTVAPALAQRQQVLWLQRAPGQKLYCACYRANAPRGVVVISHGFTETAEKYLEPIWYFLQLGLHVLCFDHCGHGRSYRLCEDPSLVDIDHFERYVNDLLLVALCAKRQYPRLPLLLYGHSMGGGIAAAAAAKRPALFKKVILSSPMIRPNTGATPWAAAKRAARLLCLAGQGGRYMAGQKPYAGPEPFEHSAAASRARFDYYQQKRCAQPLLQTSAGSYRWLWQAARLNHWLMHTGYKRPHMPVLIFAAQQEAFVCNAELRRFASRANAHGGQVQLRTIEGAKHEIYNAGNEALQPYWQQIAAFMAGG